MSDVRLNAMAVAASVAVASFFVLLKLWALATTGSVSVAASLADSAVDLMVSLAGLAAILYAAKPMDADHPFGHSSAEDLAALGQAVVLLCAAAAVGWVAAARLLGPAEPLVNQGRGIVAMTVAVVVTTALVGWQSLVARRTGNRVVRADRLHYLGDLAPNLGALVSLWASAQFGIVRLDAVVGLGAAAFLAAGAGRIGKGAWDALMDRAADPALVAGIEEIVARWPGIRGYHDLKTRTAGGRIFVNLHIELDGAQSLAEAHAVGARLKRAIVDAYPQAEVIIHKDPAVR